MEFKKDKSKLIFTKDEYNYLEFDLSDGRFIKTTNGKSRAVKNPQSFFRGYNYYSLVGLIETTHKDFINFIARDNCRCQNMGTLLQRVKKYAGAETWCHLGYGKIIDESTMKFSPKEVGKRGMKLIEKLKNKTSNSRYENGEDLYSLIQKIITECSNKEDRDMFFNTIDFVLEKEYFKNEEKALSYYFSNKSKIKKCVKDYGCDLKTLLNYIIFKVETMENYGYRAWFDYADFLNMQFKLIGKIKEKYPKFLKSNHDVMVRIYQEYKKEYEQEIFYNSIDKSLEYEDLLNRKYKIVLPQTPQDLKDEGLNLGHCVASYIDSIIEGKRQVIFLREAENEQESLLTLDIKNNKIQQCEGKGRRKPNESELKAIRQYCKIKKLKEAF